MDDTQQYVVSRSALEKLSKFLSELPYKYKDDIDAIAKGFNGAKLVKIAPDSNEVKSDQAQ